MAGALVWFSGLILDVSMVRPLHLGDYESIEQRLAMTLLLARIGAGLDVPGQRDIVTTTLLQLADAHEAGGRLADTERALREVIRLQEYGYGLNDAEAARARYEVFVREHGTQAVHPEVP